jgi:hypothetical protein
MFMFQIEDFDVSIEIMCAQNNVPDSALAAAAEKTI